MQKRCKTDCIELDLYRTRYFPVLTIHKNITSMAYQNISTDIFVLCRILWGHGIKQRNINIKVVSERCLCALACFLRHQETVIAQAY